MKVERYDIEAAKNITNMLRRRFPTEHARLMAELRGNAGLRGLGAAEEDEVGWWDRILSAGGQALTTIVDFKLSEEVTRATTTSQMRAQQEYDAAVAAEMQRQAVLAAKAQTAAMEYQNQMEFQRQQLELKQAGDRALGRMNWALVGVAGLLGLWLFARMAT